MCFVYRDIHAQRVNRIKHNSRKDCAYIYIYRIYKTIQSLSDERDKGGWRRFSHFNIIRHNGNSLRVMAFCSVVAQRRYFGADTPIQCFVHTHTQIYIYDSYSNSMADLHVENQLRNRRRFTLMCAVKSKV